MRRHALWVATAVALVACDHQLDGPTPTVSAVPMPHLVCNEQRVTPVSIVGTGLSAMPIGTATEPRLELPRIRLVPTMDLSGGALTGEAIAIPDDSSQPAESGVRWYSQERMEIDVAPELALPDAIHALEIENPNGHTTRFEAALAAVPAPTLESAVPMAICVAQGDVMLELRGTGFLEIDGAPASRPTVELRDGAGAVVATITPDALGGCARLPAPATDTQSCTTMTITVPMSAVEPGTYSIVVTNPAPADCVSTEAITVEVVPPPELVATTPSRICTGGGTIGLTGTGFRAGASSTVGTLDAASVVVASGGTQATATFGAGLAPGTYDVTIRNPEGCSDTLASAITVVDGPILFWVDPPVIYGGIATQITIYVSGASGTIDSVTIAPPGGTATTLAFSFDAARGRIQAVVPAGTTAGEYDVRVSADGCDTVLPRGLRVTEMLDLTVTRVDPGFGRTDAITSIAISGTGFAATPRAYLNPATPTPTTVATSLRSVSFVDAMRLTGLVPEGLPAGTYDLIVVNPTGEVGLAEDAFTVTISPPPVIGEVLPAELENDMPATVVVTGIGFASPTASLACLLPDGTSGIAPVTVGASTATSVTLTVDVTALPSGTVCQLRVTNPDGSYDEFSAISVTTPASNLEPTTFTSELGTARRAPAVVSGRAARQARFLYALGGDSGADVGALATGEAAPIDPFGRLGSWAMLATELPGPITRAEAVRLGRYVYLAGGHDGATALSGAWRAEILDPLRAPVVTDVGARRGGGTGLGPGIWQYRVSAVFPASDADNPSGESLPSDSLVIQLPEGLPDTLLITLDWSEVTGASAYRIYRSPAAGAVPGAEEFLVEVPSSMRTYEDDGGATMPGTAVLALGALGEWRALPSMSVARAGIGLAHGTDPADPSVEYLYATGGRDAAGAPLASYEHLRVRTAADGSQTIGAAWIAGLQPIGAARSEHGVYSVDHSIAPDAVPEGTSYVYVVGGNGAMLLADASVGVVSAGGDLGTFAVVTSVSPRNAGFVATEGNGFLYLFGGGPSPVRASAVSGELCIGAACSPAGAIDNWNAQGFSLLTARYLARGVVESAHVFVIGGADAAGAALRSVETTVW